MYGIKCGPLLLIYSVVCLCVCLSVCIGHIGGHSRCSLGCELVTLKEPDIDLEAVFPSGSLREFCGEGAYVSMLCDTLQVLTRVPYPSV